MATTNAAAEKPKKIHKKCKLTGPVQDHRGKHYDNGTEIELIADFGGSYQVKLPNGSNILCGPGVIDLASVVDFDDSPKVEVKVETQPMLSGDDLKVGKGSEKAQEAATIRKYRDARYLYTRACEMGCEAVEKAVEKYINEELVPKLPKDYKIPADNYCFSKEEVKSTILTPDELKAVVDFSAGLMTEEEKKIVDKKLGLPKKVEPKVEAVKVDPKSPSKKYADFEGTTVVDFNIVGFHKQPPKEVMIDGIKHIERPIPVFFKLGDYPDKDNFSMNEEEGKAAVKDFAEHLKDGAPIVISHKPTVLDDHNTAKLVGLELKGDTFSAVARLPEWLDKFVVKSGKMGISARWSKDKKRLIHGALVPDPRIEDAAVVASFSKELYAEFEANIPMDAPPMAGDSTPVPDMDGDGDADGADADQAKALHGKDLGQAIEEEIQMTLEDIAKDPERHASKYVGVLQKLLALAQGLQGNTEDDNATEPPIETPQGQNMNGKDFSKENESLTVLVSNLKTENKNLKDENDLIRATSVVSIARTEKKIEPHDFENIKADLVRACKDDRALGTVDFAKGESRFSSLSKRILSLPKHPLMVSTQDLANAQILLGDKGADFAKDEKEEAEKTRQIDAARKIAGIPPKETPSKNGNNGHSKN